MGSATEKHTELKNLLESLAWPTLEEVENEHIQATLKHFGGNKTKVASVLGIDRRTLYRKLAKAARGQGR